MSKVTNIGSRIHSVERGNVVAGANEILDDQKGKKQDVINSEVNAELVRLDQSKQNNLTFDNTPTENSNNPVKSGGVYAADKALSDAIEAILILIPSAATALNQLADKNFVNSSIATDTATFRGTSETGLSEAQFLEWANGLTHDMNDYVFWQTIDEAGNTLFKRYKWNGTQWLYEYTLNNSSFTADQWAAITSGITTALVEKLVGLPTNAALQQALNSKQDALTFDNVPTEGSTNPVKSGGVYSAVKAEEDARLNLAQTVSEIGGDVSQIEDVIPAGATAQNQLVSNASMEAYVASIIQNITASFTLSTADGHINLALTQVNGQVATLTLSSSDIASAQALTALTGRVTTAEGNITSLTGRVSTNETDIANLQQLYNDLQQSKPVPVTALPETGQQQGVIYRLAGTTSYSDYMWNGSMWVLMATYNNAVDPRPKKASQNLVTSGGVFDNMSALDVSELNATENPHTPAIYVDLSAALAAIPTDYQKGGMSIKYVQSSDNNYVQYRYMPNDAATNSKFTNPANWQLVGEQLPVFHLIGNKDESVESSKLIVKVGNIYRLWIKNPSISCSTVTTGANKLKFAVKAFKANGSGLTPDLVHIYMTDTTTPLDDYYDITIPQNTEYIKIFMKADIGAEQIVWIQDITHGEQIKEELQNEIDNSNKEIGFLDLYIGAEFKDLVWEDKLYEIDGTTLNDNTSGKYVHCPTFFPVKANTKYNIIGTTDVLKYVWFYTSVGVTGTSILHNKTRDWFTVENDGYIRIGIGDGDSFTPSDASACGGILGLNALKVSDNEHTQQIYSLNNKVGIIDKNFFMLGEMGFPANAPFTYNTNSSRICTKENVYLELKAGDVIGIIGKEGSSTGSRFYYGWIDANGNYKNGGEWIYDRVTIQEDGKYVIYFRDATDVIQDNVDYLFSQLFFDLSSRENDGSLPAYYEPYFSNKVQEIWNEITDGNANDTLIFLTDTHTNYNCLKGGLIVNQLYENLGIKKVFNGGDICDSDGSTWGEIQESLKKYSKYIASFSPELYNVRGNHDFNGDVDNVLSGYSSEVVKSWLLNYTDNNIVTNPADPDGTYYYFDNGASRIRYIVIDHYTGSSTGVNNKTDWVQFDWICTQAINTTPNGWSIVFFSHEPLTKRFNVYAATFTNMKGIVDAAKNKTTVTLNNVTYDFSNLGADVIACVAGHCHMDIVTWDNNVLYIRTTSNRLDNWLTPFSEGTIFGVLDKPSGTKYEQAMDVMVFKPSDNMICCHRVGFGVNRYIHLTKVSISVNGTYQLAATKLTPSSWVSSNCDGGTYDRPTNTWSYNASDIVSVNSSGLVTGLQSGDAFVFAKNTDGNMEYFHVVVE